MTNSSIQVFKYRNKEVRTTEIDGETWFVAKDVCAILEIIDHRSAVQALEDDDLREVVMNIVNAQK